MKTHGRYWLSLFLANRLTLQIAISFAILFSNQNSFAQYCDTPNEPEIMMMGGGGFGNPDCQSQLNYFPDAYSPILYVK